MRIQLKVWGRGSWCIIGNWPEQAGAAKRHLGDKWSVVFCFFCFFYSLTRITRMDWVFSSAHQFPFLWLLFFSFLLIGIFILRWLKLQYMFESERVYMHMDVVDCLFVLVHSRNCPCSTDTPHLSLLCHQFRSPLGLWVASQSLKAILLCSVVITLTWT